MYDAKIERVKTLRSWSTVCKPNMADPSDKGLAAVFDLLKISLSKADPTLDKSNALKGLVVAAVGRAEAAGELKGGNPNQIATDVDVQVQSSAALYTLEAESLENLEVLLYEQFSFSVRSTQHSHAL